MVWSHLADYSQDTLFLAVEPHQSPAEYFLINQKELLLDTEIIHG